MNVACPSCQSSFEIDADLAAGPGVPLCADCARAGAAPPPPPPVRRSRPRVPVLSLGPEEAAPRPDLPREDASRDLLDDAWPDEAPVSLDDIDVLSSRHNAEGAPRSVSGRAREGAASSSSAAIDGGFVRSGKPSSVLPPPLESGPGSRRTEPSLSELTTDVEPVSLQDLGLVLGPAAKPPAWAPTLPAKRDALAPPPPARARTATTTGLGEVATTLRPRGVRAPSPRPAPPANAPAPVRVPAPAKPVVTAPRAEPAAKLGAAAQVAPKNGPRVGAAGDVAPPAGRPGAGSDVAAKLVEQPASKADLEAEAARPSFFRVDSSRPPPAPAPASEIPVDFDDAPPDSGHVDLASLLAASRAPARPHDDDELMRLDGGLFGGAASPPPSPVALLRPPISEPAPARPHAPISPVLVVPPPPAVPRAPAPAPPRPPQPDAPPVSVSSRPLSSRPPPLPTARVMVEGVAVELAAPSKAPPPAKAGPSARPSARPPSRAPQPDDAVVSARHGKGPTGNLFAFVAAAAFVAIGSAYAALRLVPGPGDEAATTSAPPAIVVREAATTRTPTQDPAPPQAPAPAKTVVPATSVDPAPAKTADVAPPQAPAPRPEPSPAKTAEPARPRPTDPPVADRPVPDRAPPPPKPTAAPAPPPAPAGGGGEFDRNAAKAALSAAASGATGCRKGDDEGGGGRVSVTFAPSGRVTSANVIGGPFKGTPTGGCVSRTFRGITVPPFSGDPITVTKDFVVQ